MFCKFRPSKVDREEAAKAAKDIANGHALQAIIDQYFKLTAIQQATRSVDDQDKIQ